MTTSRIRVNKAYQHYMAQRAWVEEHGGNLAGYIARYGSKHDPDHFGEGGEAIYAADYAEYLKLQAIYLALAEKNGRL